MAGSSFGKNITVTTWGESHGPALGAVLDGCPAGISLDASDIQKFLDRRKPGTSAVTTARKEDDSVELLSGIFEGKTTGTPISMMIRNTSQHSGDYGNLVNTFRPGHADYCFDTKFGIRDYRGGGRSSGRETAARVATGAVAMKILNELGITIHAVTASIGDIAVPTPILDALSENEEGINISLSNSVVMPDSNIASVAEALIKKCREEKDSIGGSIYCFVKGMPTGIGDPVFDKLDAKLSQALFSIGAVKAVEIGNGIEASKKRGSENNDPIRCDSTGKVTFSTNNSGGILGGISNGDLIKLHAYFKPTPSVYRPQDTIMKNPDGSYDNTELEIEGRHDPVIVPRAVVVVECMTALTVLDALLDNIGSRMEHLKKIYG